MPKSRDAPSPVTVLHNFSSLESTESATSTPNQICEEEASTPVFPNNGSVLTEPHSTQSRFPFIRCLRKLVNDPSVCTWRTTEHCGEKREAFSFGDRGRTEKAMPIVGFKSSKYDSLKRQINAYGFKTTKAGWIHPLNQVIHLARRSNIRLL